MYDILVPLIHGMIMNQSGPDLDTAHEAMVLICTIVDIQLNRGLFRSHIAMKEVGCD